MSRSYGEHELSIGPEKPTVPGEHPIILERSTSLPFRLKNDMMNLKL